MFPLHRRAAAALPRATAWEDAWYDLAAGGLPTDPEAPPDASEASRPPFVLAEALAMKRQVVPTYPERAKREQLPDSTCLAAITIGLDGRVADVAGPRR
ncbi:MAG: hypothetical protein H0V89_00240 [Deltaproteobacteria bacterium]|nr:hypothetical protein [Deltaproteobacteria bacterium]